MQIKIEIDVKPEELRRFLGIPDVSGLPEDVSQFAKELLESASDKLDPAALLRANLDIIRKSPRLRRIWLGAAAEEPADEEAPAPPRKGRLRKRPGKASR